MYSGVNQGDEMPPTVTLSSFWPVMLMVFTGLMTLPTLIISAVVVARIPEQIDTKGITASIDSSSINQLTAVTASLNSIKTALALQNSYLGNNVSALNGQVGGLGGSGGYVDGSGNPADPSGSPPNVECQADTTTSTLFPSDMFLTAQDDSTGTATTVLLAKVCKPCGSATSFEVIFAGDATNGGPKFTSMKPYYGDLSSSTKKPSIQLNGGGQIIEYATTKKSLTSLTDYVTSIDLPTGQQSVTWGGGVTASDSASASGNIKWSSISFHVKKNTGYVTDSVKINYKKSGFHTPSSVSKDTTNNLQMLTLGNLPAGLQTTANLLTCT